MAQTANAIALKDCTVSLSTGGTTFTDISGFAAEVKLSGAKRQTGHAFTFDGDIAIIRAGKREPLVIQVTAIYTEVSTEPWETFVRPVYEAGSSIYIRYSPRGLATGTGEFVFTSDAAYITDLPYPQGKSDGGDPVKYMLTIETPQITKTTSTT